ncbi:MAG: GNAT family N-acetyltransferase [Anaerolineales bacterium]|jgi:GNAT superfamily N-acetyltransferase
MAPRPTHLNRAHITEAAKVLARAFDGDPLMQAFFAEALIPADQARQELFRLSCLIRLELGWPLIGVMENRKVCGVACISFPEHPGWPDRLEDLYVEYKQKIGLEPAKIFDRYTLLVDQNRPKKAHHFLAVLGVDPQYQGRGLGGLLLEDVHQRAAAHPTSTGVALDTENPRNLTFYEHHGYSLTSVSKLGDIKLYHFFRPV